MVKLVREEFLEYGEIFIQKNPVCAWKIQPYFLICFLRAKFTANFSNFAGLFEHPVLPEYYLAGTTDGIGTKIIPLIERKLYKTISAGFSCNEFE